MVESEYSDDSWEDFFGSSPELMPSIMGAFDAIIGTQSKDKEPEVAIKTSTPKRVHQSSNFANLSSCVQKILSNVPDQEISRKFNSEESLGPKRLSNKSTHRSFRSPEKANNKNNDSLDNNLISTTIQKMLSNLPDNELVISASTLSKNSSYLYNHAASKKEFLDKLLECESTNGNQTIPYHPDDTNRGNNNSDFESTDSNCESAWTSENCDTYSPKPLGSYLHSPLGIASRTPTGRQHIRKYLQVPSESSLGTISTASSEVSRPVSLTSLGSCSSSGSSGHHQPGSAYLASAESLDSDPEPAGSQGSADSGIAEQEQPMSTPEQRVLQEVLDTETVYVSDLNEVIKGYLEPWRADPDCPLAQHLHDLFSNLEEIYKFNKSFLEDLKKAECDPSETANCFRLHYSGFSVYNEYCTNYPRTMDVLVKLTRDENMAVLFREKQLQLHHALPLGSYLLKPVQRILKYHLLLQRLSKQCELQHKSTVDLALATMTGIASDINKMKEKHEHAVRVQEIQSQLYGWNGPDLTALGELIAEGTFRVAGARGRRHVFLFEKVLLLAKSKSGGALAYKAHIMCSNLMLVEQVRGEPLSFQVLPFDNPRLQSTLKARSPQHKREWTLQIKRVILENYTAVIPNHARQLVLQLGQDLNENDGSTDKWSPLKQSSAPHYLERRSRVRKIRDLNSRRTSSQDRTFPSLGNWRRKSEPSMVPNYNSKTMPKKISKIKKDKEIKSATFYTDLEDSENYEMIGESIESLSQDPIESKTKEVEEKAEEDQGTEDTLKSNLEKIVSDIIMQNENFQKAFSRNRKTVTSDPTSNWCEEEIKLPTKADSLPRSFQLNDQIDAIEEHKLDCKNVNLMQNMSLKENSDEQHENNLSSHLDDSEHPDHKIYRKSPIRFSILQRIRHLMSEEQKHIQKYPVYKQGSKSMGEKIANPDYADPHKFFTSSRQSSQVNLSIEDPDQHEDNDIMGEPELLDLTINENEVLNEFDKRLKGSTNEYDTGQKFHISSLSTTKSEITLSSSQNSDSYYESILEDSLKEEYVKDASGKLVAKQDSFSSNESKVHYTQKFFEKQCTVLAGKPSVIKRPNKAPPPIPQKPTRLFTNTNNFARNTFTETVNSSMSKSTITKTVSTEECNSQHESGSTTSWVKTMVGRFE